MNLQHKPCTEIFGFHSLVNLNHCNFDNVCGCALHRHISCNSLSECTDHMLARGEFGKISSSAEHRFNIAVSVRLFDNIFHIAVNTAVMGKIAFNVVLCLFI